MQSVVFELSVPLPAQPNVVFWDLLEPSHVPDYDSRMRSWLPREFPPEVGTRVDFEVKLGPIWSKGVSEFIEFDPPRGLALQLVEPKTPLLSTLTWVLVPAKTGTEFTYRFHCEAPKGMSWLARWAVRAATGHLETELPALANRYR